MKRTAEEARDLVDRVRAGILDTLDPFERPIRRHVTERLLLYPTEGALLTEGQFGALSKCLEESRESELCVVSTFTSTLQPDDPDFAFAIVGSGDFSGYRSLGDEAGYSFADNLVMPLSARWCILVSVDGHAVAAGEELFIRCLSQSGPLDRNDMALGFAESSLRLSKSLKRDPGWIPELLAHILGADDAEAIWRRVSS